MKVSVTRRGPREEASLVVSYSLTIGWRRCPVPVITMTCMNAMSDVADGPSSVDDANVALPCGLAPGPRGGGIICRYVRHWTSGADPHLRDRAPRLRSQEPSAARAVARARDAGVQAGERGVRVDHPDQPRDR